MRYDVPRKVMESVPGRGESISVVNLNIAWALLDRCRDQILSCLRHGSAVCRDWCFLLVDAKKNALVDLCVIPPGLHRVVRQLG